MRGCAWKQYAWPHFSSRWRSRTRRRSSPSPARWPTAGPARGSIATTSTGSEDPELAVAELADHGVKTLYVETASWKVPNRVDIVAPEQTKALLSAAHANGLKVVAWYLPGFVKLQTDMRRIRAALAFRTADGQAFD